MVIFSYLKSVSENFDAINKFLGLFFHHFWHTVQVYLRYFTFIPVDLLGEHRVVDSIPGFMYPLDTPEVHRGNSSSVLPVVPKDLQMSGDSYICPNNCGKKYKMKSSLHNHLKLECGKMPQFRCHICHRAFKQKVGLKSHLILIHQITSTKF